MDKFVDLHTHVLPGLDDGARDVSDALEMLGALEKIGFKHVFATPHHRLYSWEGIKAETVENSVRDLSEAAAREGIDISLLPGMEFDLDETLPERSLSVPGGASHLLVDVGFWGVPRDLAGLLGRVISSGVRVLLVHPERNGKLCRKSAALSELIDSGVRFLGNVGSFSGMYGDLVRRDARYLLKEGFYWAMASDLHTADQLPWIRAGIRELASLAGESSVQDLMAQRPMEIVTAMEGDL